MKRELRRCLSRWSQDTCAEQIGITPRYLGDIERGDKTPAMATFLRILNALEASADDVLQDSLVVGYVAKSNDLLKRLESLDPLRRKQALDFLAGIISFLEQV